MLKYYVNWMVVKIQKKLYFIPPNSCETITVSPRYRTEVCSTKPKRLRAE